jgi:hypothetical protein
MQSINGYKYNNEADALHAQDICRINEGLPKPRMEEPCRRLTYNMPL